MKGDHVINEINTFLKKKDFDENCHICECLVNKAVWNWENSIGRDDISVVVGIIMGDKDKKMIKGV